MTALSSGIQGCIFTHQRAAAVAAGPVLDAGDPCGTDRRISRPPASARARLPAASRRRRLCTSGRGSSLRRPTSRQVILFLAADPGDSTRLALDAECAAIEHELRMTQGRDAFDFRSKWAVNVDEMMRHLNEYQPVIIHVAGHGGTGLHLQDERRVAALTKMIESAAPATRLVVLDACFSSALAQSLCTLVDCVVGTDRAISDDAARCFAVAFYRALGNWCSIGNAIAQAIATLTAKRFPDEHVPVCRTRDGVNADQLFLPKP